MEIIKVNSEKDYCANAILNFIIGFILVCVYGTIIQVIIFRFNFDPMIIFAIIPAIPATILNLLIHSPIICAIIGLCAYYHLYDNKMIIFIACGVVFICAFTWPYILSLLGYIKYTYKYTTTICEFSNYQAIINPSCVKAGIDIGFLILGGYLLVIIICVIIWSIYYAIHKKCFKNEYTELDS